MANERLRRLLKAVKAPGNFLSPRRPPQPGVMLELPRQRTAAHGGGYLAVAAIVRNEELDLAEWLEFQRLVGVEHAYIYDDCSTDGTRAALAPFVEDGFVTVIPWSRFVQSTGQQYFAYAHALTTFGPSWRWMAFIDRDEYLFPVADEPLPVVLSHYEDLPAIVVPWHMFGFSGHERRPKGLVLENYTERLPFPPPPEPRALLKWKSIVDPSAVTGLGTVSFFRLKDGRVGGYTEDRLWVNAIPGGWRNTSTNILRLNHYFTQSREDLTRRRARDGAASATDISGSDDREQTLRNLNRVDAMVQAIESAEPVRDELILRYVPRMRRMNLAVADESVPRRHLTPTA